MPSTGKGSIVIVSDPSDDSLKVWSVAVGDEAVDDVHLNIQTILNAINSTEPYASASGNYNVFVIDDVTIAHSY